MQKSNSLVREGWPEGQIRESDVRAINGGTGFHHLPETQPAQVLMEGRLFPVQLSNDLFLHLADCYEKETTVSSSEVSPGLSVNLVYEADIRFSLGGESYELRHSVKDAADRQPLMHALVVGRSDMFSRYIEKGHRVKKLNITMSSDWLRARFRGDTAMIEALYQSHGSSKTWALPPALDAVAERLITMKPSPDARQRLTIEADVLSIIAAALTHLEESVKLKQPLISGRRAQYQLLDLVDSAVESGAELSEIARNGRMSVSTLQSQFKKTFNITVQKYIRKRVLERARCKLITGNLSIGEVAYQAGYNHSSNFITAFRREFGITPAECISRHQNTVVKRA
jgi:AraC-like DNA-binding protein